MASKNKRWKKDTYVASNWVELNEVLHSPPLISKNPSAGGHYRSPFCFRGMANSNWDMDTSLQRLGSNPLKVEKPLLRSFRKFAKRGTFINSSDWEVASIAQHNGLPTRILDWTASPLIAAHFATWDPSAKNEDAVIWCINVQDYRKKVLPKKVRKALRKEDAWVFDLPHLISFYPSFEEFDNSPDDILLLFEPPSIDDRIQNQYGLFSAMNGAELKMEDHLHFCNHKYPGLVKRIIIKASAKQEIRDILDENNINERMLFPGLPGLCDWLRRRFSPVK